MTGKILNRSILTCYITYAEPTFVNGVANMDTKQMANLVGGSRVVRAIAFFNSSSVSSSMVRSTSILNDTLTIATNNHDLNQKFGLFIIFSVS